MFLVRRSINVQMTVCHFFYQKAVIFAVKKCHEHCAVMDYSIIKTCTDMLLYQIVDNFNG